MYYLCIMYKGDQKGYKRGTKQDTDRSNWNYLNPLKKNGFYFRNEIKDIISIRFTHYPLNYLFLHPDISQNGFLMTKRNRYGISIQNST